jgi:hypothetical protein
MIVENVENKSRIPYDAGKPEFSIKGSPTEKLIQKAIISTGKLFLIHIAKADYQIKLSNEDYFTQEFVAILERNLRSQKLPFCVQKTYHDIYTRNANHKRSVDFYFYPSELGKLTRSIYSVEAKRLPAPDNYKGREREYVKGKKINTGGIEKFRNEEHGKGLNECAILAFVEDKTFEYWFKTINQWICDENWKACEKLSGFEKFDSFAKSFSEVCRTIEKLTLFHFWISLK